LEMRTLVRLSWLVAGRALIVITNSTSKICRTKFCSNNRFVAVLIAFALTLALSHFVGEGMNAI
jgi:hypothetical protein